MAAIISTERATINCLRIGSTDCIDESVKCFSNSGASVRLPRNAKDDFWWNRDGLFVIKNCSEQDCTVNVEVLKCTGDLMVMRSSHQSARTHQVGHCFTRLLKGGESLIFRANNALHRGREANL